MASLPGFAATCTRLGVSLLCASALVLRAAPARAQQVELSRARIAELVGQAPDARASEAQVGVSRAAVTAAGVLSLENPLISGLGGFRFAPDGSRRLAGTATLSWPVDTGGKRGTRKEAAAAEHHEARATSHVERQRLLMTLLLRHAAVLRDERQVVLTEARAANAQRVLSTATRRRDAGSVPPIDVSLATLQYGRDAAAALTAQGERRADTARLAALLGLPEGQSIAVAGELVPAGDPPTLELMLRLVEKRSDVQAASASVQAAQARASRERAASSPTLNILAQYERDDGANIGTVGLAVPLALLNANAVAKATSQAEVKAAQAAKSAIRSAAIGQIRESYSRYESTRQAREVLAPTAAAAKEAVALATRAYDLGEGDLASVLLVQREAVEAQRALLEAEYAHAVAKLELLISAGRTPQ